jgi:putative spermidine/putrescine transport system substrate-binding protein
MRSDSKIRLAMEETRMRTKLDVRLGCARLGCERLGCALFGVWLGTIGLASTATHAAEQITFVSQGGAYQQAQTVAILDPSAKKLGITINQDSIPDAWPAIKTQVGSGKPIWDVVDTPTGYCLRARRG